jgi:hypothetical protein
MPISLKEFARPLSTVTGYSPDAIYERQRELQAAGLIESPGTRGPGGGVRATPETAAILLAALLATDAKADTAEAARSLLALRTEDGRPGRNTFGDALMELLREGDRARDVLEIHVHRRQDLASMTYRTNDQQSETVWYTNGPLPFERPVPADYPLLTIMVRMTGRALEVLSDAMKDQPTKMVMVTIELIPPEPQIPVTRFVTLDKN